MALNTGISTDELHQVLEENILHYWMTRMVDHEHGGFYGRIDGRDQLYPRFHKSVILNTRILWTFSAAYRLTDRAAYKEMADWAFGYLTSQFEDKEHGGLHWMLDHTGLPVNSKKQVYAQSFGIYALSEYYQVNQDARSLELAKRLFHLIETNAFDSQHNGYIEALAKDWSPLEDVRLSEKDLNASKTMNTHLHILEGYTNLYRVWKSDYLREQLINLLQLMMSRFLSNGHLHLFFDDEWKLLSDEISFGHDIEASWLMYEAAEVVGDESLMTTIKDTAIKMVEATMPGFDSDGGLMNEARGSIIFDTDKHWWPQAEALVGLTNAWELTGEDKYVNQMEKTWEFTKNHLIDANGEWHWKVNRNGVVDLQEDKAGPWKCPYHNGRAMMEMIVRMKRTGSNH